MATIDIMFLVIIVLSVAVSVIRGFIKEAMSVVIWVGAVVVSAKYYSQVDEKLLNVIQNSSIRLIAAFAVLFIATLILGAIVNRFLGAIINGSGLSGPDKALGAVFGIVRGVLIVVALVVLAETAIPQETWWKESMFMGHIKELTTWLKQALQASSGLLKSALPT